MYLVGRKGKGRGRKESKEEVCEECCWPWWLFLLLGIAALLGSLGMIALLGLALAALGGKKSGGGKKRDPNRPRGDSDI